MIALLPCMSISLQVWLLIYVALINDLSTEIFEALFAVQILAGISDFYNLLYISKNITSRVEKIVKATFFLSTTFTTIIIILLCKSKYEIEDTNKDENTRIAWYVSLSFFIVAKAFLMYKNARYFYQQNNTYVDVV